MKQRVQIFLSAMTGGYQVEAPDLGVTVFGESADAACQVAADACQDRIAGMRRLGLPLPRFRGPAEFSGAYIGAISQYVTLRDVRAVD